MLRCAVALADLSQRPTAAVALARMMGADDLIIFVRDPQIGQSLPAAGFPQTLQGRRSWQALIDRAIEGETAEGSVTGADGPLDARAIGVADGTVVVLIGGNPEQTAVALLRSLLPMFGSLMRLEAVAHQAAVESTMARQAAAQSSQLASKLDSTRAELQRAVDVAEKATRARDEFLATVSHELRTPLTSIIGWIQLLRMERDARLLADGLETIERNARAQTRLIEDILDFSRINAGKLRLEVSPTDLVDVMNTAIEVVRPAADAKGVRVESVFDPDAAHVSGDSDRLQQVMWNLLSNAVKFTPRGGRVQLRLERINSQCEVTVTDTGQGIAPEFLPHVFDRFSQADGSSTRIHAGLGLGLGIVRHLVELHGGTVQAFSPGLGAGSTFAVRLPLLVAHASGVAAQSVEAPPSRSLQQHTELTGISIVVVEDNADSRRLLTTILSRSGAVVRAAESVPAALRLLSTERPDIVISDIEMPGEDGYSLIRKIRLQEPPATHLPAIALTAYTRSVDRVRALEAGFQVHMSKPVEPVELVAAVKSLLAGQRKLHA
ncbi:MAG TPA: ATP-binding protein [Thermoanaerobaculia bacterium]|nr:ATP-binding protein [Thermoanaerobaculia bacterium]